LKRGAEERRSPEGKEDRGIFEGAPGNAPRSLARLHRYSAMNASTAPAVVHSSIWPLEDSRSFWTQVARVPDVRLKLLSAETSAWGKSRRGGRRCWPLQNLMPGVPDDVSVSGTAERSGHPAVYGISQNDARTRATSTRISGLRFRRCSTMKTTIFGRATRSGFRACRRCSWWKRTARFRA